MHLGPNANLASTYVEGTFSEQTTLKEEHAGSFLSTLNRTNLLRVKHQRALKGARPIDGNIWGQNHCLALEKAALVLTFIPVHKTTMQV